MRALMPAAYCGSPPVPAELAWRWNVDPALLLVLAGVALAYGIGARRSGAITSMQRSAFLAGWSVVVVAFVSPLCALAVALFSARVAQHMALVLVAAPLIAWGRPDRALRTLLGREGRDKPMRDAWWAGMTPAWLAFAAVLWLWHLPLPYDAALRSTALYWLMNVSLLACAWHLWHAHLIGLARERAGPVALASLATSMQMGLLGALITFSTAPLYASHQATTLAWGLTALEDQQLGGLLMWVPGGIVLLLSALHAMALVLRPHAAVARPH